MTMSDRIAVMNTGRYEQLGEPEDLYERPRTRFVAGFLGVSNLLHGRSDGAADDYGVVRLADGAAIRVPRAAVTDAPELEIGVRPEKIRIVEAGSAPVNGSNVLEGTVRDASYLGVSTQYIVELRTGEAVTVYEQNVARTVHGSLFQSGQQVQLCWSPDHTFVVGSEGPAEAGSTPAASDV